MDKNKFNCVAFSRVVTLAGKVAENFEHDTEDFEAYMYDYLCVVISRLSEIKRSSLYPTKENKIR